MGLPPWELHPCEPTHGFVVDAEQFVRHLQLLGEDCGSHLRQVAYPNTALLAGVVRVGHGFEDNAHGFAEGESYQSGGSYSSHGGGI